MVDSGEKLIVVSATVGDDAEEAGRILGFELNAQPAWEPVNLWEAAFLPRDPEGTTAGFFVTAELEMGTFFPGYGTSIVAAGNDRASGGARIVILDPTTGDELFSFAHPGKIYDLKIVDMNRDGYSELFFAGANNGILKALERNSLVPPNATIQGSGREDYFQVAVLVQPVLGARLRSPNSEYPGYELGFKWFAIAGPFWRGISIDAMDLNTDGVTEALVSTAGVKYLINYAGDVVGSQLKPVAPLIVVSMVDGRVVARVRGVRQDQWYGDFERLYGYDDGEDFNIILAYLRYYGRGAYD